MRYLVAIVPIVCAGLCGPTVSLGDEPAKAANAKPVEKPAFKFGDVEYFHRYTEGDLHEYTPAGQTDLNRWQDMLSINDYCMVRDGNGLADIANRVLADYKKKGAVLRTESVPRTKEKPAEHLVVVLFVHPEFVELAFTRFRIHKGMGISVVYSHRYYGEKAEQEMGDWIKANGAKTEKTLMAWRDVPERTKAEESEAQTIEGS